MRTALSTERLELRLSTAGDLKELHAIFSDRASNSIGDGPFASTSETSSWIARRQLRWEETGLVWYAVRLRSTGELVGNAGSTPGRTGEKTPELGYLIAAHYRRRHYALEAARAVLTEMLHEHTRVYATIRPANLPSISIVGQLGFRLERIEHDGKGPCSTTSTTDTYLKRMANSRVQMNATSHREGLAVFLLPRLDASAPTLGTVSTVPELPPTVRMAVDADRDALWPLVREFATSFVPRRADFDVLLPRLLARQDDTVVLVAESADGAVVGYLLASTHLTFLANGPVAWVEEVMVDVAHRIAGSAVC